MTRAGARLLGIAGARSYVSDDGGRQWLPAGRLPIRARQWPMGPRWWILTAVGRTAYAAACNPYLSSNAGCPTPVFTTTDGGRTWRPSSGLPAEGTSFLHLFTAETGVLITFVSYPVVASQVWVTRDGLHRWRKVTQFPSFQVDTVGWENRDTGWIVGQNCSQTACPTDIIATHNGGRTWSPMRLVTG
jgi:hypothetical protein